MFESTRHWHPRELRFLGLIALTGLLAGFYLSESLRLAGREGTGWRTLDLQALHRRIEIGELRDREAVWWRPATPEEAATSGAVR